MVRHGRIRKLSHCVCLDAHLCVYLHPQNAAVLLGCRHKIKNGKNTDMKKALLFAAMLFAVSCNENDYPEYYTPPTIGNIECSPVLEDVSPGEEVEVKADILNLYGSAQVCIMYKVGDDTSSAAIAQRQHTEPVTIRDNKTYAFSQNLPAQEAGKCVIFYVYCLNIYGVDAASAEYVYTVKSE